MIILINSSKIKFLSTSKMRDAISI